MALSINQRNVLDELAESEQKELSVNAKIMLDDAPSDTDEDDIAKLKARWQEHAEELIFADWDDEELSRLIKSILLGDDEELCLDDEEDFCADVEVAPIDVDRLALRVFELLRRQVRIERERMTYM